MRRWPICFAQAIACAGFSRGWFIPELRVAAKTSSFSFKGENVDIRTIAEKLNVEHILEGSVRKAGDTLRIIAQLIAPTPAITSGHSVSIGSSRT